MLVLRVYVLFKSRVKWSFVDHLFFLGLLVIIRVLVGLKFEEQNVLYEEVDPANADAHIP